MSDHNFVLSDQDGVLVGHMSFQVKKIKRPRLTSADKAGLLLTVY